MYETMESSNPLLEIKDFQTCIYICNAFTFLLPKKQEL